MLASSQVRAVRPEANLMLFLDNQVNRTGGLLTSLQQSAGDSASERLVTKCPYGDENGTIVSQQQHLYVNLTSFWYIFLALITTVGLLVSLVSNMIIIFLFSRTPTLRRNPSNIIAANLSLSDLLYCTQWPTVIYCSITQSTWMLEINLLCQTFGFITVSTALASILTVLAMSIERAIVIIYSIHAKSRFTNRAAWLIVVAIWIVSVCSCLPPLFGKFNRYTLDPSKTSCTLDYLSSDRNHKLYILALYVAYWIIPALLITICYSLIIATFKRSTKSLRKVDDCALSHAPSATKAFRQHHHNHQHQLEHTDSAHFWWPVRSAMSGARSESTRSSPFAGFSPAPLGFQRGRPLRDSVRLYNHTARLACAGSAPKKGRSSETLGPTAGGASLTHNIKSSVPAPPKPTESCAATSGWPQCGHCCKVPACGRQTPAQKPAAADAARLKCRCETAARGACIPRLHGRLQGRPTSSSETAAAMNSSPTTPHSTAGQITIDTSQTYGGDESGDKVDQCRRAFMAQTKHSAGSGSELAPKRAADGGEDDHHQHDKSLPASVSVCTGRRQLSDLSRRRRMLAQAIRSKTLDEINVGAPAPATGSSASSFAAGNETSAAAASIGLASDETRDTNNPPSSRRQSASSTFAKFVPKSTRNWLKNVRQQSSSTMSVQSLGGLVSGYLMGNGGGGSGSGEGAGYNRPPPLLSSNSSTNLQNSRSTIQFRLAKMSFYLILLWFVSWSPIATLAMLNSVLKCHRASALAVFTACTMTKLGPAFDVFIYGISHPKIKSKFKQVIMWPLMVRRLSRRMGIKAVDEYSNGRHQVFHHSGDLSDRSSIRSATGDLIGCSERVGANQSVIQMVNIKIGYKVPR